MWRVINKYKKSWFFKIEGACRATPAKNKIDFERKLVGYGTLPGCPGRVCSVIARFLAGGQTMDPVRENYGTLREN